MIIGGSPTICGRPSTSFTSLLKAFRLSFVRAFSTPFRNRLAWLFFASALIIDSISSTSSRRYQRSNRRIGAISRIASR